MRSSANPEWYRDIKDLGIPSYRDGRTGATRPACRGFGPRHWAARRWRALGHPAYAERQIEAIRRGVAALFSDPEYRARWSDMARELWKDRDYRALQRLAAPAKYRKSAASHRRNWKDPKIRARLMAAPRRVAMYASPEFRAALSRGVTRWASRPGVREGMRARTKRLWRDEGYRERLRAAEPARAAKASAAMRKRWADPAWRAKMMAARKRAAAKRAARRKRAAA